MIHQKYGTAQSKNKLTIGSLLLNYLNRSIGIQFNENEGQNSILNVKLTTNGKIGLCKSAFKASELYEIKVVP
jgi:hypothetical protein